MAAPLDELAFVARSEHRVGTLEALLDGPRDRNALREATGASSPTVGRVVADLEQRRWVVREGRTYGLTELGTFVADEFGRLQRAMETVARLRDVEPYLPSEMPGFAVDLFEDAVVAVPGPGYPYEPVERVTELIEGADSMRGFGTTVLKSSNLEAACDAILDGLPFEFVYSPTVLETVVSWNPERVLEAAGCDNCTTYVHEALPDRESCGLGLYDDRVGLCCHDAETGLLRASIDTGSSAAHDWAETTYERYRREARLVEADELRSR